MPPLTIAYDDPGRVAARAATQDDPLLMYVVVRREIATDLAAVLAAAGSLIARAPDAFARDPRFAADVSAWRSVSFRKVTLRANEKDWSRLLEREVVATAPAGEPVVAVLPPRRRSAVTSFLRNLQAWTADPVDLGWGSAASPAEAPPAVEAVSVVAPAVAPPTAAVVEAVSIAAGVAALAADLPAVLVAPDPALTMSAGKMVAQVGHACQLVAAAAGLVGGAGWVADVDSWLAAGAPVVAVRASPSGWERLLEREACVAVEDGGLTEVAPGTRTVLATRPALGPERARLLEILAETSA